MKRLFTITAPDKQRYAIYAETLAEAKQQWLEKCTFHKEALTPISVYDKIWNLIHTGSSAYRKECIDILEEFANEQKPEPVSQKVQAPNACDNGVLSPVWVIAQLEGINIRSSAGYEQAIRLLHDFANASQLHCKHPWHTAWKLLYEAYEHLVHLKLAGSHLHWIEKYKKFHADCNDSIIDKQNYPL